LSAFLNISLIIDVYYLSRNFFNDKNHHCIIIKITAMRIYNVTQKKMNLKSRLDIFIYKKNINLFRKNFSFDLIVFVLMQVLFLFASIGTQSRLKSMNELVYVVLI